MTSALLVVDYAVCWLRHTRLQHHEHPKVADCDMVRNTLPIYIVHGISNPRFATN
jgi:hypothetical protein